MASKKQKRISVEKINGEFEKYNPDKLRSSLKNVGADEATISNILKKTEKILYDGIKTKKLFSFIHNELDKTKPSSGLKYNLRKAIFELRIHGGFVFEKFVGRVLEKKGYDIKMNQIIKGKNVTHEIDVSATKPISGKNEKLMVEVKHHQKKGITESIQTALYVYARFLEVKEFYTRPMLVTNTKFSNQVIKYSKGQGIRLMGWKYPNKDSLEKNIEKYHLYPITILGLSKEQTRKYLNKGIITIKELKEQKSISKKTKEKIEKLISKD